MQINGAGMFFTYSSITENRRHGTTGINAPLISKSRFIYCQHSNQLQIVLHQRVVQQILVILIFCILLLAYQRTGYTASKSSTVDSWGFFLYNIVYLSQDQRTTNTASKSSTVDSWVFLYNIVYLSQDQQTTNTASKSSTVDSCYFDVLYTSY